MDDNSELDDVDFTYCGVCHRHIIKSNAWHVDGNFPCIIRPSIGNFSSNTYGTAWNAF